MTKSKTAVKNADEFERLNSKRGEQMKYLGKPAGMWALFAGSFEKHLTVEFDLTAEQAKALGTIYKGGVVVPIILTLLLTVIALSVI